MIVVFYGTGAELIKMLGIIQRIPREEQLLICTSQQNSGLEKVHKQLGVTPDVRLSNGWFGKDITSIPKMAAVMSRVHASFLTKLPALRKRIKDHDKKHGTKSVAIVHGDTLTTVVGSYMGRWLGLPIAHVEAGLRTHNWRSPFPEELDRRIATKFARIHYTPNPEAEQNLINEGAKGDIVKTAYNTAKDSIEQSATFVSEGFAKLNLPDKYCLVLLHRTELIENKDALESILKAIHNHASKETPVVFTEHSTTGAKVELYKLGHYLKKEGLTVIPKQPYFDFMEIVRRSEYIVTDGGGLQEDAFFLSIPTIIHRKVTERPDGLGFNAELSHFDVKNVTKFLKSHKSKADLKKEIENISPSQIVVDDLKARSFIS